jgi:hypothetical protein
VNTVSFVEGIGPYEVKALVEQEILGFDVVEDHQARLLEDFQNALLEPEMVTVNFSGGLSQECWAVTRSNGAYRVVYMPLAGYFSLCVESEFGPVDIGVHGNAIDCFGSV